MNKYRKDRECHDCGKPLTNAEHATCKQCDKIVLTTIAIVAIAIPIVSVISWWLTNG